MRLLLGFVGGRGHLEPLVPIARAAADAGHRVAFAGPPSTQAMVEAAGFESLTTGVAGSPPAPRVPLRPVDRARETRDLRERFARRAARARVPQLLALCESWLPDVIVCDETDFGAPIAAERLGIPHAVCELNASGSFVRAAGVGEALGELRVEQGLPPQAGAEARSGVLSPFPESLRDPAQPAPARLQRYRAVAPIPPGEPAWSAARHAAPVVYFTLGTVFNLECGDLFLRVLAGLRELDVEVVATVGDAVDPAELGEQPSHVHVERFLPQAAVLPHCAAVVCHAGSGSLLGALAHGLPSVLIPLGADQPWNADRCDRLGVARVLDALRATRGDVEAAVSEVLHDPAYGRRARLVQDEIERLPSPARAVAWLEEIAAPSHPGATGPP